MRKLATLAVRLAALTAVLTLAACGPEHFPGPHPGHPQAPAAPVPPPPGG